MKLMVILNLYICVSLKSRYLMVDLNEDRGNRHRRASCHTAVTREEAAAGETH